MKRLVVLGAGESGVGAAILAKVKGYDLLGKVSQWQYYVNSNGRYETWTNNMRRYVMFSLAYRFSLTPKKQ